MGTGSVEEPAIRSQAIPYSLFPIPCFYARQAQTLHDSVSG
jgi:hypothetical protein